MLLDTLALSTWMTIWKDLRLRLFLGAEVRITVSHWSVAPHLPDIWHLEAGQGKRQRIWERTRRTDDAEASTCCSSPGSVSVSQPHPSRTQAMGSNCAGGNSLRSRDTDNDFCHMLTARHCHWPDKRPHKHGQPRTAAWRLRLGSTMSVMYARNTAISSTSGPDCTSLGAGPDDHVVSHERTRRASRQKPESGVRQAEKLK